MMTRPTRGAVAILTPPQPILFLLVQLEYLTVAGRHATIVSPNLCKLPKCHGDTITRQTSTFAQVQTAWRLALAMDGMCHIGLPCGALIAWLNTLRRENRHCQLSIGHQHSQIRSVDNGAESRMHHWQRPEAASCFPICRWESGSSIHPNHGGHSSHPTWVGSSEQGSVFYHSKHTCFVVHAPATPASCGIGIGRIDARSLSKCACGVCPKLLPLCPAAEKVSRSNHLAQINAAAVQRGEERVKKHVLLRRPLKTRRVPSQLSTLELRW